MTAPGTTAGTRAVALLGRPVAHSLSPQIHSAAFAAAGLDVVYLACDVAPRDLAEAVAGVRTLGFLGANVTVPHKLAIRELADERTGEVDAVGAANTLFWRDGGLVADNTDAVGLERAVREALDPEEGDPVLIFGAGGAARAAAVAFGRLGAAVRVRARRAEAAAEIDALAKAHGGRSCQDFEPRIVVNATPLGLDGEPLPSDLMALRPGQVALDLIYRPTPFLEAAAARGAQAVDGLGMLVGQAAASFERWTGKAAPVEVMTRAAREAREH
jgi:shikimate dehydrogenase